MQIKTKMNNKQFKPSFRWGHLKTEKLSEDIDINDLRRARPMMVDEPLFSSTILVSEKKNEKILKNLNSLSSNMNVRYIYIFFG
jgi:hypothetical protein